MPLLMIWPSSDRGSGKAAGEHFFAWKTAGFTADGGGLECHNRGFLITEKLLGKQSQLAAFNAAN